MIRRLAALSVSALALAAPALADVPRVATDILPVHSLAAKVMEGLGRPDLIVPAGASPHGYALRPSEAGALERAELVIWVGEGLMPQLAGSIETLAGDAAVLELMALDTSVKRPFREGATFEKHGHADDGDHEHEHGDDDHEHGHDAQAHDDHADGGHDHGDDDHGDHAGHDDHAHGAEDPHAWLDPENGKAWLDAIAAALSQADPENAGTYYANAAAGKAELDALSAEITETLAPVQEADYIVFHDAYQYFEARFGISAAGSISLADASDPSAARIAEIRDKVAELGVRCVFSEPQFDAGLVAAVFEGAEAETAVIDPLGIGLEPGPALYPALLRDLSRDMAACLAGERDKDQ
ncbi:MAG: zinc ABC transporter substrate-binding protein [Paracoccaceae bacterium]